MTPGGLRPYAEVIGDPIAHSKSPLIHGFWLERLGIEADYRASHVRPEALKDFIESRRAEPAWQGCNVTIPHKIAILDHIADPGNIRDTIGAANTVFRDEDRALVCTNTDAAGFYTPLSQTDLAGRSAVVVGAGGAALAVLFALSKIGIGNVDIVARNPIKAMGLLARFGLRGQVRGFDAPLPAAALLVNASPLGMTGQEPYVPDLTRLDPQAMVYDLVYAPLETPLLAAARAEGLDVIDGLDMLIGQAAAAFELFFGQVAPREDDRALRALLTA